MYVFYIQRSVRVGRYSCNTALDYDLYYASVCAYIAYAPSVTISHLFDTHILLIYKFVNCSPYGLH